MLHKSQYTYIQLQKNAITASTFASTIFNIIIIIIIIRLLEKRKAN